MELNITHLFPELLNLYGDRGNIASLTKRLEWRGITPNVINAEKKEDIDLSKTDILFLGGGSDRDQVIVLNELLKMREEIVSFVENDGVLIAICGGYQLLGNFYQQKSERLEGIKLLDIETTSKDDRLIGNVVINCEIDGLNFDVVGFENHNGRTNIKNYTALGKVVKGQGNNGTDGFEGILYKNVFGTYLHGPLLPKNPVLTDVILSRALSKKYPDFKGLEPLDDTLEITANKTVKELILK